MFRNPLTDVIVVLVIVLLIMGPRKLPQLGRGLGQGMREFKDGITGDSKHTDDDDTPRKLPQVGRDLGQGMREFKDGITGDSEHTDDDTPSLTQANAMPPTGTADERPAQTAAAPGRDAGSEPRA